MRKRIVLVIGLALLFTPAGCIFVGSHPHGMPPGQAKKVVAPVIIKR